MWRQCLFSLLFLQGHSSNVLESSHPEPWLLPSKGCPCQKSTPHRLSWPLATALPACLRLPAIFHRIIWDKQFCRWKVKHFSLKFLFQCLLKGTVWTLLVLGSNLLSLLELCLMETSAAFFSDKSHFNQTQLLYFLVYIFTFQGKKKKKIFGWCIF